ncbi:hypothetical protein CIHG_06209 [Coccidioides immitis H538.4]|uniref:Fungal-type protein kinase domain-containing protein n=1 Tax=Coccidioides immitis H538.4 TaxID=396776 RepID=A0A0J8RWC2_COCIT|nr:hypothetical protein CIHG_06209 [Coccidioides immitis H538.4]
MTELSPADCAIIEKCRLSNTSHNLHRRLEEADQALRNPNPPRSDACQKAVLRLLYFLQGQEAAFDLRSKTRDGSVASELATLFRHVEGNFHYDHYRPLVQLVIQKAPDTDIWKAVFDLIATVTQVERSTPPPRPSLPILQTPRSRNTSSLANSSELRRDIDPVLRGELLSSLHKITIHLERPPADLWLSLQSRSPGPPQSGKLDIGFVDDLHATPDKRYEWSQILVPGELKNDRKYDIPSGARLDLARYAREVLSAQDDRRFVLGFTLCGPLLRVWEFDRCGGIGSEETDINKDGLQFIMVILGFLFMDRPQLGFDPTIVTVDGRRCIEIERDGKKERLVIDEVILRAHCVAGRATTCWKAHRETDESRIPLVIKDSWQYAERHEEGELLREAMESGATRIARYDFHETVQVDGKDDNVQAMRKGLEVPKSKSKQGSLQVALRGSASNRGSQSSAISRKRSSDYSSPPNRVHRRVIVQDYGKPIYESSSRVALLIGMEGCIVGYESLYSKARLIQSDISPRNLLVNEEDDNPSWRSFLIDLDLAIRAERDGFSGARGKTGTRAFMAIGVLYGEKHSFMHDLESFFWVLFWICVHYEGPGRARHVEDFERWNYMNTRDLAGAKKGVISDESDFLTTMDEYFTPYYQPLSRWVNRLRRVVFPNGGRWKKTNSSLGSEMRKVLRDAQKDPEVID